MKTETTKRTFDLMQEMNNQNNLIFDEMIFFKDIVPQLKKLLKLRKEPLNVNETGEIMQNNINSLIARKPNTDLSVLAISEPFNVWLIYSNNYKFIFNVYRYFDVSQVSSLPFDFNYNIILNYGDVKSNLPENATDETIVYSTDTLSKYNAKTLLNFLGVLNKIGDNISLGTKRDYPLKAFTKTDLFGEFGFIIAPKVEY